MIKWIISIVLMIGLLSGCNIRKNANSYNSEDANGQRFVNNNVLEKARREQEARNISWNNQNPNFVTSPDSSSNIATVNSKVREVISKYTDYTPGPVWNNANKINVTVYTNKKFSTKEKRKKAHDKLHKLILQAFPSFDVDVKIKRK